MPSDHGWKVYSILILLFDMPINSKRFRAHGCCFRKLRVVKSHIGSEVEKGGKRLRPSPYKKAFPFECLKNLSCKINTGRTRLSAVPGLPLQNEDKETKGNCLNQARLIVYTKKRRRLSTENYLFPRFFCPIFVGSAL